jgi:hypothetical protein
VFGVGEASADTAVFGDGGREEDGGREAGVEEVGGVVCWRGGREGLAFLG